jgi:hypothetical protein
MKKFSPGEITNVDIYYNSVSTASLEAYEY